MADLEAQGSGWGAAPVTGATHGISMEAIPAGFPTGDPRPDDRPMVRVAVSLWPVDGAGSGLTSKLHDWPTTLEDYAAEGFDFYVTTTPHDDRNWHQVAGAQRALSAAGMANGGLYDGDGSGLTDLWQRLMGPELTPCLTGPGALWRPWDDLDAVIRQPTEPDPVDRPAAILPTLRSEAAMVASMKRAVLTMERMALAGSDLSPATKAGLLKARSPYRRTKDGGHRSWLKDAKAPGARDVGKDEIRKAVGKARQAAAARRALNSATSAGDKAAARRALAEAIRPSVRLQDLAKAIVRNDKALFGAVEDEVNAVTALLLDPGEPPTAASPSEPAFVSRTEAARRRLFGVQALPLLARVFNFVIEFELGSDALLAALTAARPATTPGLGGTLRPDHAFYLAVVKKDELPRRPGPNTKGTPWVATQFRMPLLPATDDYGRSGHFWPAETGWVADVIARGTPAPEGRQREGLIVLSGTTADGEPLFDVASVDTVGAVVSAQKQEAWQATEADDHAPERHTFAGDTGIAEPRLTLRTAGLGLLDRTLAGRRNELPEPSEPSAVIRGAEELLFGYRLDVGVNPRGAAPGFLEWRSLNNRVIHLSDPAALLSLDRIVDRLPLSSVDRIRLDANTIMAPVRTGIGTTPDNVLEPQNTAGETELDTRRRGAATDALEITAGVTAKTSEDLLAVWQGDPLGIECREVSALVPAETDLAIRQRVSPISVSQGRKLLPPPLRFGKAYAFGMRAVFVGGVTMPLHEAQLRYNEIPDVTLAPRRFLRMERIDPPELTITAAQARNTVAARRYPIDGAGMAVLRRISGTAESAAGNTTKSRRILVAPAVPQDFAGLHGVLDGVGTMTGFRPAAAIDGGETVVVPTDGLANVRYDTAPSGGFPVLNLDDPALIVDRLDRAIDDPVEGYQPPPGQRYDAVFDVRRTGSDRAAVRHKAYYPDPAAATMIIAVRKRHGDRAFLPGTRREVNLYPRGSYPEAAVVVVDLKPVGVRASAPQQENVVGTASVGYLDSAEEFYPGTGRVPAGTVAAQRVEISLAPGEDFDIVSWCVPTVDQFHDWFELPQAVAIVASLRNPGASINAACVAGWRAVSPETAALLDLPAADLEADIACGPGGLPVPDRTVLEQLAGAMLTLHRREPIPEIASPRVFRVVHAVSKPEHAPAFAPENVYPMRLVRRIFATEPVPPPANGPPSTGPGMETLDQFLARPETTWGQGAAANHDGATDVLFVARVGIDLDTSRNVDIICSAVSPNAPLLDDIRRARPKNVTVAQLRADRELRVRTYGFDIDPATDKVELIPTSFVLATLEAERPLSGDHRPGLEFFDINRDHDPDSVTGGLKRRPYKQRHTFNDPLARVLTLHLESNSRYADLFKDIDKRILGYDPTTQDQLLKPHLSVRSNRNHDVSLNCPATVRPTRIDPQSILRAFIWERSEVTRATGITKVVSRRVVARLRFRRPWFTSGEGEKLGIVLWPPNLFTIAPSDLANNFVPAPVCTPADPPDPAGIDPSCVLPAGPAAWEEFTDRNLGPGGPFVTRWGGDPTGKSPTSDGWFMPRDAFADFVGPEPPELVTAVTMPVPKGDDQPDDGTPQPTLLVSLLAYTPRFDMETESWYVDVEIDPFDMAEPFVRFGLVRYQANAPAHLQVSEPVVAWTQLQPRRTVTVDVRPAAGGQRRVDVAVTGRAPIRAAALADAPEPGADGAEHPEMLPRHRPQMRIAILRRDGAFPLEETVATAGGDELAWTSADDPLAQPRQVNEGLEWRTSFTLGPAAGAAHAIYVEEINYLPPVRYARDLAPGARVPAELVESGPRFAARMDLGW